MSHSLFARPCEGTVLVTSTNGVTGTGGSGCDQPASVRTVRVREGAHWLVRRRNLCDAHFAAALATAAPKEHS